MPRSFARLSLLLCLLCASGVSLGATISLRWTAPGDNGKTGTADHYDLRRSSHLITAANFLLADSMVGMPTPLPAGSAQMATVFLPSPDSIYYLALRTCDRAGNWSTLSNIVTSAGRLAVPEVMVATALSPPWPDPALALVRLRLSLRRVGDAAVEVFDTAGRKIRVLTSGQLLAGDHELMWDLRDELGARVRPGMYLVRARTEDGMKTQRVAVLR